MSQTIHAMLRRSVKPAECEQRINEMRVECDLPQRTEYFYSFSPLTRDSTFTTRLVRLAFEEARPDGKKRRYWIVWNASLVGGLDRKELAELR
jgi:hypothetical protein